MTPTRLLSAGADTVVVEATEIAVCEKAGDCSAAETFESARHEILMETDGARETDGIRGAALDEIVSFVGAAR